MAKPAWSPTQREEVALKLRNAFRPGTPINAMNLFAERRKESGALLAAINQNGQHAILFGERGVGKTSLANVLFYLVECPGWTKLTPIVNCQRSDTFGSLWGRVLLELADVARVQDLQLPSSFKRPLRAAQEAFFEPITVDVVLRVLSDAARLAMVVIVLDEFDTLADQGARAAIADMVKYFSDRNAPFTIVMVGVSDDVEGLVADHRSIERCLQQVRMPRMSRRELEDIVIKCLSVVKADDRPMEIANAAVQEISRLATGLPHYAHLLGLYAGLEAVENSCATVAQAHVSIAISAALENAHQSIQNAYLRATESPQSTAKYCEVLTACAMAETNALGFFSAADVRTPLTRILKKPARIENFNRHLHTFCDEASGPILQRDEFRGRPQFRFINPLMQPFALMKGMERKKITEEDLRATKREPDLLF